MTERPATDLPVHLDQEHPEPDEPDSPSTGVPAVDQALAALDGVEDLPLEEQLAAFERAHEGLRSALDAQPAEPGEPA